MQKKSRLVFLTVVTTKMVKGYFDILQSSLLQKLLSKKVKYISVAQLFHEIFLKTFQIEFSNFCNFVNFFLQDFSYKRWSSIIIDLEALPQPTHLKMTKSKKSLKIVPL